MKRTRGEEVRSDSRVVDKEVKRRAEEEEVKEKCVF